MLAPYILSPTLMALISPRLGKFNVTSKGGVVDRTFFDSRIALPFLFMLLLNIAGLLIAIPRSSSGTRRAAACAHERHVVLLQYRHSRRLHRRGARVATAPHHSSRDVTYPLSLSCPAEDRSPADRRHFQRRRGHFRRHHVNSHQALWSTYFCAPLGGHSFARFRGLSGGLGIARSF